MAERVRSLPISEVPYQSSLSEPVAVTCPNCEAATSGNFCSTCGQANGSLRPTVKDLLRDVTRYVFRVDGKFLLTLRKLLVPGLLTREYFAGRRERYERPFRFYLVINVAFFLVLGAARSTAFDVTATTRLITGFQENVARFDQEQAVRAASGQPLRTEPRPVRYARSIATRTPQQVQQLLHDQYQRWGPKVLLAVIPITALALTLVYRRRGLRFAEHFVFCLHYQAFSTLVTLPAQLSGSMLAVGVAAVIDAAYLCLSMKGVYADGWFSTAWRFLVVYGFAGLTMGALTTGLILGLTIASL